MKPSSTLALHINATAIITAYQATAADIKTHFAGLVESERLLNLALGHDDPYGTGAIRIVPSRYQDGADFTRPEQAIKRLRHNVWDRIVELLELRKWLSVAKWDELNRLIDSDEMPEITHDSVGQFVAGLVDQRGDLLKDAVQETSEFLRPAPRASVKTFKCNSEMEVPPKVILTSMVGGFHCIRGGLNYHREQQVLAMERVFAMLDGKGEISKSHYSEIGEALKKGPIGETPHFRFRACANGNLHLWFTRLDLLKRFNQLAGGKRLRPEKRRDVARSDAMEVSDG